MRSFVLGFLFTTCLAGGALAQTIGDGPPEYVYTHELDPGTAPGLKVTELSPKVRSFQLVFASGDDVIGGLEDFYNKNHLNIVHFTGLGALDRAVIGWGDPIKSREKKSAVKIYRLNEYMEITSLIGDITRDAEGKPDVHAHIVVGLLKNGATYSGHLLQGHVRVLILHLDAYDPLSQTAETTAK